MWDIDMWDIDMWDIDLSDTDLDLLDKDIPSKHFVCLQDVWRLQDMSSRHVFKTSSRRLQRNNFSADNVLQDQQMLLG